MLINRRSFMASSLAAMAANSTPAMTPMVETEFKLRYQDLLTRFQVQHPGVLREFRIITLAGNALPWIDIGMDVEKGDSLSVLANGEVYISRAAHLTLLPRIVLWTRAGSANIFRPGTDTSSFKANGSGPFCVATLQGKWSTPRGDHSSPGAYKTIEGALNILVIRWTHDAEKGMNLLAEFATDDALITEERQRLRAPIRLPHGFDELWYVGSGANFNQTSIDGEPAIAVRSELNGGIIRAPVDLPVTDQLYVEWDWRMHQSPSTQSEDALPFHQYVSIAVEFDDGQDLSWYWSAKLDRGTHYVCPLPSWPGETHLVVRTNAIDDGSWQNERRNVRADIELALIKQPKRIVGVWLIALTAFGQRSASTDFRRIAVVDERGRKHKVFPA